LEGFRSAALIDNNPAHGLFRVIQEFDSICNLWSRGQRSDPDGVWKRLRELRAEPFVEFERWARVSVDQVLAKK
jgi:hypothetical protein